MSQDNDLDLVGRELSSAMRVMTLAVVEGTKFAQQRKLDQLQQQQDEQRTAEQALNDHRKELLRGAPTQHQQRWQNNLGGDDAVALKLWDEVYTGVVATNPNGEGDVSVRFDDPRVGEAYGDVWNVQELQVRRPGDPEIKAKASTQPDAAPTVVEQKWQDELGRGDIVKTAKRGNIGTITTDPDDAGQVAVYFCNKTKGTHFEGYFQTDDLQVVTPGDPVLKNSAEPFSVEGPNNQQVEITNGPALDKTGKPPTIDKTTTARSQEAAEKAAVVVGRSEAERVAEKQEWQNSIGRGDTVKALDRGNIGTVTTNPDDAGEVMVHFVNSGKGTEYERSFKTDQLEVTKPAAQPIKSSDGEPFTVAGANKVQRTVLHGPAIPDTTVEPKVPVVVPKPQPVRSTKIAEHDKQVASEQIQNLRKQLDTTPKSVGNVPDGQVPGPNTARKVLAPSRAPGVQR